MREKGVCRSPTLNIAAQAVAPLPPRRARLPGCCEVGARRGRTGGRRRRGQPSGVPGCRPAGSGSSRAPRYARLERPLAMGPQQGLEPAQESESVGSGFLSLLQSTSLKQFSARSGAALKPRFGLVVRSLILRGRNERPNLSLRADSLLSLGLRKQVPSFSAFEISALAVGPRGRVGIPFASSRTRSSPSQNLASAPSVELRH